MLAGKTNTKQVSLMEQGSADKIKQSASQTSLDSVRWYRIIWKKYGIITQKPTVSCMMSYTWSQSGLYCKRVNIFYTQKHIDTQCNFLSSRQRGLADSYHQTPDRSLLNTNNQWRPELVISSHSWGWGGMTEIMLHAHGGSGSGLRGRVGDSKCVWEKPGQPWH